jgi:hypothetical protein
MRAGLTGERARKIANGYLAVLGARAFKGDNRALS